MICSALILAGVGAAPLGMTLSWLIVVPSACSRRVGQRPAARRAPEHRAPAVAAPRGQRAAPLVALPARALAVGFADAIGGVVFVRWLLRDPRGRFAGSSATRSTGRAAHGGLRGPPGLRRRRRDRPLVVAFTTGYVVTALPFPPAAPGASRPPWRSP